jgi:biopolymer transport protein ExbD
MSATTTICPHCQAEHPVNANRAGQRIRCPACDQLFEIVLGRPDPPPAEEEEVVELMAAPPAPQLMPLAAPPAAAPQLTPLAAPVLQPLAEEPRWTAPPPKPPPPPAAPPTLKSMMGARGKSGGQEAEMDMTPMVDVTFQLLIFFMLTASFVMQRSQQHPKQQTEEKGTQASTTLQDIQEDPDYVTVRIDALGAFHVSAAAWGEELEVPSLQELLVKLRQARSGDRQPTRLLVIANGEAVHDRVVAAVDAGAEVGMEDVKLLTVEDDG